MRRITHNTAGAMLAAAALLGGAAADTAPTATPGLALLGLATISAIVWSRTR